MKYDSFPIKSDHQSRDGEKLENKAKIYHMKCESVVDIFPLKQRTFIRWSLIITNKWTDSFPTQTSRFSITLGVHQRFHSWNEKYTSRSRHELPNKSREFITFSLYGIKKLITAPNRVIVFS